MNGILQPTGISYIQTNNTQVILMAVLEKKTYGWGDFQRGSIENLIFCQMGRVNWEKMQLVVEVSPPANHSQMSYLQIHKFVKVITYMDWLLRLTTHLADNAC